MSQVLYSFSGRSRHDGRLAGAGVQPCGCQSWLCAACFHGESAGSLAFALFGLGAAVSCMSWLSFTGEGAVVGCCDCNGSTGCCLSGASRAEGLAAHLASAWAARSLMRSCRATSCCCSAIEGGSKRVCRSHCIHEADEAVSQPVSRSRLGRGR